MVCWLCLTCFRICFFFRYMAMVYPLKSMKYRTKRHAMQMIIFTNIPPLIVALPFAIYSESKKVSFKLPVHNPVICRAYFSGKVPYAILVYIFMFALPLFIKCWTGMHIMCVLKSREVQPHSSVRSSSVRSQLCDADDGDTSRRSCPGFTVSGSLSRRGRPVVHRSLSTSFSNQSRIGNSAHGEVKCAANGNTEMKKLASVRALHQKSLNRDNASFRASLVRSPSKRCRNHTTKNPAIAECNVDHVTPNHKMASTRVVSEMNGAVHTEVVDRNDNSVADQHKSEQIGVQRTGSLKHTSTASPKPKPKPTLNVQSGCSYKMLELPDEVPKPTPLRRLSRDGSYGSLQFLHPDQRVMEGLAPTRRFCSLQRLAEDVNKGTSLQRLSRRVFTREQRQPPIESFSLPQQQAKTRLVLLVLLVHLLTSLPYFIQHILLIIAEINHETEDEHNADVTSTIIELIIKLQAVLDPIIVIATSKSIKTALMNCCRWKKLLFRRISREEGQSAGSAGQ